jgi:hypothetical protein
MTNNSIGLMRKIDEEILMKMFNSNNSDKYKQTLNMKLKNLKDETISNFKSGVMDIIITAVSDFLTIQIEEIIDCLKGDFNQKLSQPKLFDEFLVSTKKTGYSHFLINEVDSFCEDIVPIAHKEDIKDAKLKMKILNKFKVQNDVDTSTNTKIILEIQKSKKLFFYCPEFILESYKKRVKKYKSASDLNYEIYNKSIMSPELTEDKLTSVIGRIKRMTCDHLLRHNIVYKPKE